MCFLSQGSITASIATQEVLFSISSSRCGSFQCELLLIDGSIPSMFKTTISDVSRGEFVVVDFAAGDEVVLVHFALSGWAAFGLLVQVVDFVGAVWVATFVVGYRRLCSICFA